MKTQGKNIISFDFTNQQLDAWKINMINSKKIKYKFKGVFYKKIMYKYLSKPYRKALDEIRSV